MEDRHLDDDDLQTQDDTAGVVFRSAVPALEQTERVPSITGPACAAECLLITP